MLKFEATILRNMMLTLEQRAMARYYSEDIRYNGIPREIRDREWPKTTAILPPEFWEGQQNGSQSASVRARHLRPLCETVSSGKILLPGGFVWLS